MLLEHEGRRPRIDDSAYVAPTAVVCGDVTIGPDCRVLFGAVLTAESGPVVLGSRCIVMEQAVPRGTATHPLRLSSPLLAGPPAPLSGRLRVGDVFIATCAPILKRA